jgi:glycosyltransferase involved in cell wall biosynthesis
MPVYNPIDYDGRVQRVASALAERFDVRVVSVDSGRPFSHPAFQVRTVRLPPMERGKALLHARFLAALVGEARQWRPDVVHAHDFFMAFPGWLAARTVGARLVYDAHELIVPEPGRALSRRDRFWYRLERWAAPRADLVIAANSQRAEVMGAHYRLASAPVVVGNIPPVPSGGLSREETLARYPALGRRAPGTVRLVYQGDMDLQRGVGDLVRGLQSLPAHFELVLVGAGLHLERLRELVGELGLGERVIELGRIPREDLHAVLRTCDVGLITYAQEGWNNLLCAPNKLYEYAQAGLPTFARENPVLREIIGRWGVGVVAQDVAAGIQSLCEEMELFRSRLPAFLAANRWEAEAARLLDGYDRMLGNGPMHIAPPAREPVARRAAAG